MGNSIYDSLDFLADRRQGRLGQRIMRAEGTVRTFEGFVAAVKDSCEGHAKRKGYTTQDVDGKNQLLNVMKELHIHDQHSIGEIIYKCAEYLRAPRAVLLEKIAGWAWVMWRELPEDKSAD